MNNYKTIKTEQKGIALYITLNRPESRNAMSLHMVEELSQVFSVTAKNKDVRAVVITGSEGNFCAGGDIKDMAKARKTDGDVNDAIFELNRAFGTLITQVNLAPQVVITLLQGAVLGGGFGLACVSDIAIASNSAQFALPETSLGLPPAQIAPFVVERIGLTQARRLMLTGAKFNGEEAKTLGLVHFVVSSDEQLHSLLQQQIKQINRCAPAANSATKSLLLNTEQLNHEDLLDKAASLFSDAVNGDEGIEGTQAFIEKRRANWIKDNEQI